ncbi:MAG: glycine zipper family protein [Gammaproteobacteria bacterium]|nr:glycine zipper family protein [Gammaproteobacteria bacterium]
MNKFFLLPVIISLLSISGCARHAQIIIDPHGVDMGQYQADLAECQHLSRQVHSKVGEGVVGGAIVGAIVGKIIGGNRTAVRTSKLGALSGGLSGGAATMQERDRVVKNCLRNRGYQVLN